MIRTGFVSNSSSSSYIVCIFPDEDIKKWRGNVRDVMTSMVEEDPEIKFDITEDYMMDRLKTLQKGEHLYEWVGDEAESETMEWSVYYALFDTDYYKGNRRDRLVVKNVETNPFSGNVVNACAKEPLKKFKELL